MRCHRCYCVASWKGAKRAFCCRLIILRQRAPLCRFGCQCDVFDNGADAINAFVPGRYALALFDYNMPIMSGVDAARLLRQRASGRERIPIIMCRCPLRAACVLVPSSLSARILCSQHARYSASSAALTDDEIIAYGFDGALSKPISSDAVEVVLAHCVQGWGGISSSHSHAN